MNKQVNTMAFNIGRIVTLSLAIVQANLSFAEVEFCDSDDPDNHHSEHCHLNILSFPAGGHSNAVSIFPIVENNQVQAEFSLNFHQLQLAPGEQIAVFEISSVQTPNDYPQPEASVLTALVERSSGSDGGYRFYFRLNDGRISPIPPPAPASAYRLHSNDQLNVQLAWTTELACNQSQQKGLLSYQFSQGQSGVPSVWSYSEQWLDSALFKPATFVFAGLLSGPLLHDGSGQLHVNFQAPSASLLAPQATAPLCATPFR